MIDQREWLNTLCAFGPFLDCAAVCVVWKRVEVVISVNSKNEKARQRQPKHNAQEINVFPDSIADSIFHKDQTFRPRTRFTFFLKSVEQRRIAQMPKSLGDGNEKQIANKKHVGRQNNFLQVGTLIAQVHKNEYDVGRFDEGEDDKGPFDHAPGKGF
jgi:hypothetical protein